MEQQVEDPRKVINELVRRPTKPKMTTNRQIHADDKPHKCKQCFYSTTNKGHLRSHELTHSGERPFKCRQCPHTTNRSCNLKAHERTHTGEKPYRCQYCSYSSIQNSDLKVHERSHTREKPYKCPKCSYSSTHASNLKRHTRIHSAERPYKCGLCPYAGKYKDYLQIHEMSHSEETPIMSRYSSSSATANSSLEIPERIKEQKPYKCQHCSYSARSTSGITFHQRIHSGLKPLKSMHFSHQSSCLNLKEKRYKCVFCFKSFSQNSYLLSHIRCHTKEKTYKSLICQKKFRSNQSCKNHMKTHEANSSENFRNERPFKCQHCSYSAITKYNLKIHERIHSGEKPHKCQHCSYSATVRSSIVTHERNHLGKKPFKCQLCKYSAKQRIHLKIHQQRIHFRENPYKPQHWSNSSNQHQRSKTNMRPQTRESELRVILFPCQECNYPCFTEKELCMHYTLFHNLPVVHLDYL